MRYRYGATSDVAKLNTASWSQRAAVSLADRASGRMLVEASIRAQAALGADAYVVPGWMPDDSSEDLRASYAGIFETIGAFDDVEARPFILFVGGHTKGLDRVSELLDEVPHFVSAVYLQLSPIAPSKDSPSKLEAVMTAYQQAAARGFKVIAGHAGKPLENRLTWVSRAIAVASAA